jgi:hypothetical protein
MLCCRGSTRKSTVNLLFIYGINNIENFVPDFPLHGIRLMWPKVHTTLYYQGPGTLQVVIHMYSILVVGKRLSTSTFSVLRAVYFIHIRVYFVSALQDGDYVSGTYYVCWSKLCFQASTSTCINLVLHCSKV